MEIDIKKGIEREEETVVGEKDLATAIGSGTVEVFATPAMAALMEKASWKLVQRYLPEGFTTVGTELSVTHLKATPPGMRVFCKAKIVCVEGKKLTFEIKASDERGLIGKGGHTRYIVEKKRFEQKAGRG